MQPPYIILLNYGHFVVFEGVRKNNACLNDPAIGRRRMTLEEFEAIYGGVVLTFTPTEEFKKVKSKSSLKDLFQRANHHKDYFAALVAGLLTAGVCAAIHAVGLEKDLDAMPMGTQTVLTEDGEMISGGQRQKILIARALLNNPKILFLDEATGALDNLSQKVITDTLKATDATRVVIAHRLSTVVDCDRIIVLDGGGIAEEGTFEELMERKGIFYSMAQRQMLVTE